MRQRAAHRRQRAQVARKIALRPKLKPGQIVGGHQPAVPANPQAGGSQRSARPSAQAVAAPLSALSKRTEVAGLKGKAPAKPASPAAQDVAGPGHSALRVAKAYPPGNKGSRRHPATLRRAGHVCQVCRAINCKLRGTVTAKRLIDSQLAGAHRHTTQYNSRQRKSD